MPFVVQESAPLTVLVQAMAPLAAEVVDLKDVPSMLSLTWLTVAPPSIGMSLVQRSKSKD